MTSFRARPVWMPAPDRPALVLVASIRRARLCPRAIGKTGRRTTRFLRAALAFRTPARELGHVAWSLVAGAIACAVFLPTTGGAALQASLGSLLLITILAPVCAIDARYGIIPDAFVVALALGGVPVAVPLGLPAALGGAILVLLAGSLLQAGYRRWRGIDGLGWGDVKLLAAGSLWVGLDGVPWVLLLGVMSACVTVVQLHLMRTRVSRHDALPFGPHLAAALWLVWLLGLFQP